MSDATVTPRRILGQKEAIALIVGIVIGAGIFKTPALVASLTKDPLLMIGVWVAGGVISLIGALCYAELATTYPHAGGDYFFLQKAFGRPIAFLFGWARLSVITTGSIALLAFVFGDYMARVCPFLSPTVYAFVAVMVLFGMNIIHLKSGMRTQQILTVLQVLSLLLMIGMAFFASGPSTPSQISSSSSDLGVALIFVLLTYGGWNEAAYISAEMKGSSTRLVTSLVISILIITVLYVGISFAYLHVLGMEQMSASSAVAADFMKILLGDSAEKIISLMISICALTSINATMIVGARTNYALGQDFSFLKKLGTWDAKRDNPTASLVVQTLAALFLMGLGVVLGGTFKSMVEFTAPVFWLFFLLTGISLFVLRFKDKETPRPFKVPFYPLFPMIFCFSCAYMLYSSLSYVSHQTLGGLNAAWIGVFVLFVGILLYVLVHFSTNLKRN